MSQGTGQYLLLLVNIVGKIIRSFNAYRGGFRVVMSCAYKGYQWVIR